MLLKVVGLYMSDGSNHHRKYLIETFITKGWSSPMSKVVEYISLNAVQLLLSLISPVEFLADYEESSEQKVSFQAF